MDVLDGRRCSKHLSSITVDKYSKFQVKELKKLKVEISRQSWSLQTAATDNGVSAIGLAIKSCL